MRKISIVNFKGGPVKLRLKDLQKLQIISSKEGSDI